MEELIRDWVISNFGVSIVILIGLLALALYIGGWVAKFKKDIQNMPCEAHEKSINTQNERLNEANALLHHIEGQMASLSRVESGLADVNRSIQMLASVSAQSGLTQHHSPISLTDQGKSIASSLGLQGVLDSNWDMISSIIQGQKNPYDIQMEFITRLILNSDKYLDEASLNRIKNDAFMRGFPLPDYMRMLGVMARDKYFEEHGIEIADVDKNDPTLK